MDVGDGEGSYIASGPTIKIGYLVAMDMVVISKETFHRMMDGHPGELVSVAA